MAEIAGISSTERNLTAPTDRYLGPMTIKPNLIGEPGLANLIDNFLRSHSIILETDTGRTLILKKSGTTYSHGQVIEIHLGLWAKNEREEPMD